MTKTAFIFPGQGSQQVGMGKDVVEAYPEAQAVFEAADSILGIGLSALCFDGPEADLNETINTQPALYVSSMAMWRALETEMVLQPDFVAGHSLGEFTALTVAGALTFDDGLRLVRERGRLMQSAGEAQPGGMAALLGLADDKVEAVCQEASDKTGKPVVVANYNCPGQVVISGDNDALDEAMTLAKANGAKRAVRLAVSIAAHSPLMQVVEAEFAQLVTETPINAPKIPVYANVDAAPLLDADAIREELKRQLTQSVRWTQGVQAMLADGAAHFVEVGSGEVLTGLVKRIDRSVQRSNVNSVETLKALVQR